MKRVLADHNVPSPLLRLLKAFEVKRAAEYGWSKLKNGKLLTAVEKAGFDVLLTGDKSLPDENEISGRKVGLVAMSDNHWPIVCCYVPAIIEALHKCKPGQVLPVFCGEFNPHQRKNKPSML